MTTATAPAPSREAALDAVLAAYNDVTERLKHSHDRLADEVRRLREQLDEKNRELARRERLAALGEMAAGVAHEIRNPLSGINLFATVLCRDLSDRPECRQIAEKIVSGVRTLESIVGDILAFASQTPAESRPVAVAEVVTAVVDLIEAERRAVGATVHVDPNVEGVVVAADAHQLQRALLNLARNALEAAGADGQVWISVGPEPGGREVCINVADDGPGVPAAIRERVFNPFFTTKDTGTGLGLAIVHRIAEAHGGRVAVENRPEGGAVFRLRLRVAA
jgi:signal transduction histidine kinase